MKVSVVIPCFNERDTIEQIVNSVRRFEVRLFSSTDFRNPNPLTDFLDRINRTFCIWGFVPLSGIGLILSN